MKNKTDNFFLPQIERKFIFIRSFFIFIEIHLSNGCNKNKYLNKFIIIRIKKFII